MNIPARTPRKHLGLSAVATIMLLAAATVAALAWWKFNQQRQSEQTIATVDNKPITLTEASMALRAHLWRQGLNWAELDPASQMRQRQETLDQLIPDALIQRHFGSGEPASPVVENVFQQFLKQFEEPEAWKERAALQNLDEVSLRQRLATETHLTTALDAAVTAQMQKPTEQGIRAWFDSHPSQFVIPEYVRANQIFLTRHDPKKLDRQFEISEIHRALLAGEVTFSQLAANVSEDDRSNKKGGDLGWFSRDRVPEDFAAGVFPLSSGQISTPFETSLGWHIVWMKERRPSRPATYDEVKGEIKGLLEDKARKDALTSIIARLRQQYPIEIQQDKLAILQPAP